jgi:uncharacterized RDD family membrane protein YckC
VAARATRSASRLGDVERWLAERQALAAFRLKVPGSRAETPDGDGTTSGLRPMSTPDSFSWGAETPDLDRAVGARRRRSSLLGARAAALLIDGLVLLVPVFGVAWLLSLAFPHDGFFFAKSQASPNGATTTTNYGLKLPGFLVITALSLTYFFLFEVLRGQTIGKRAMGLEVRSASGGRAGVNATSARTVLRLIDALPFLYLLGALVALLSGRRRRRIGDFAGRTVVVRSEDILDRAVDGPAPRADWRVALYPALWIFLALFAVFGLGLGKAADEGEQAIALVQSYAKARETGNAALACSLLTREQQREVVAIQGRDYPGASASRCPTYILDTDASSHLLNPALAEFSAGPLLTYYTPLGAVLVHSQGTDMELIAVPENGQLKLDMRGVERLDFLKTCAAAGGLSPSACACTFALMRVQAVVPERRVTPAILRAIAADGRRCQQNPPAPPV